MSEHRASPPTTEFLNLIHSEDLAELQAAGLLEEVQAGFPSVARRHTELIALTYWLIAYGGLRSVDQQEVLEKDRLTKSIAASFFLDSSGQVEALVEDYEDKVFLEAV